MKSLAVLGAIFFPGTFVAVSQRTVVPSQPRESNYRLCSTDAVRDGKSQGPALLDVLGRHSAFDFRSLGHLDVLDVLAEREREAARDEIG